jgi:hypothetical protein
MSEQMHGATTKVDPSVIDLSTGDVASDAAYVTEPLEPDKSLGELFSNLTGDLSDLMRKEVELAKVEIKEEVRDAGKGAGLLGAGAFCGYLAVLLISFAAAWGLSEIVPEGIAFLIVGVFYAIAALVLGLMGKQEIAQVDPVPQQTVETLQEDVRWAKQQLS